MSDKRQYYRRGKALLYDDYLGMYATALQDAIDKLPPEKQKLITRKALKQTPKEIDSILDKIKDVTFKAAQDDIKQAIEEDGRDRAEFEERLYEDHKELFDNFTALVGVSIEAVQKHREITNNQIGDKDKLLPLLLRLHARVCRIANEIITLARTGYGTGALARWRAMHEITVVMLYLREQGPKAIKVFADHGVVSKYKAMKEYQKHAEKLGEKPFSAYEVRLAKQKYERRMAKYGRNFKKDYGWANYLSGGTINNFKDLEEHVGIDHLRPYYKFSSLGIHAEWASLSSGEEFEALNSSGIVLVGPADYGFEDAVSLALLTLAHATTIILTYNNSMHSLVYAKIVMQLEQDTQASLGNIIRQKYNKQSK